MIVIAAKTRNRLLVETISSMLVLSLVGPPQAKFEPAKYVKELLNCHRNAGDMRGSKVAENTHGNRCIRLVSDANNLSCNRHSLWCVHKYATVL